MKLFRFGENGREKPGIIWNDLRLDFSTSIDDFNESFFASGGLERLTFLLETTPSIETTFTVVPAENPVRPSGGNAVKNYLRWT